MLDSLSPDFKYRNSCVGQGTSSSFIFCNTIKRHLTKRQLVLLTLPTWQKVCVTLTRTQLFPFNHHDDIRGRQRAACSGRTWGLINLITRQPYPELLIGFTNAACHRCVISSSLAAAALTWGGDVPGLNTAIRGLESEPWALSQKRKILHRYVFFTWLLCS